MARTMHYLRARSKQNPNKEADMLKDILIKIGTEGDIDAMISGEISIQFPTKEMVDKLSNAEYKELMCRILMDNRLFSQTK